MGDAALASLDWLAIVLAAGSMFVVGALWYGPLLGKPWMAHTGMTEEKAREANMAMIFGLAFVLELLAAIALAMFIGPEADLAFGAFAGFMTGVFFVATAIGVVYLFERKPAGLWAIDAGYQAVGFTLMGAIIGAL